MNPLKTVFLIDWQARYLEIRVSKEKELDFTDAYFRMLSKQHDLFRQSFSEISSLIITCLQTSVIDKYLDTWYVGKEKPDIDLCQLTADLDYAAKKMEVR